MPSNIKLPDILIGIHEAKKVIVFSENCGKAASANLSIFPFWSDGASFNSGFGRARQGGVKLSPWNLPVGILEWKNRYREQIYTIISIDFDEQCVGCIKEEQAVIWRLRRLLLTLISDDFWWFRIILNRLKKVYIFNENMYIITKPCFFKWL